MQCPQCQQDNPPQAKFCLECGTRLVLTCAQCGTELPAGAKFCLECGQPVGTRPVMPSRFATPETYTPKHLAEKILTARSDLEGERKQVTVLFADLKDSTGADRRPRPRGSPAAPRPGPGPHDGRRAPLRGHGEPGAWAMALWPCLAPRGPRGSRRARLLRRPGHAGGAAPLHRGGAPHARPGGADAASGSTPEKWWCGPSATTCTWTTRPWARRRTWRRAWNNSPRRAASG